MPRHYIQSGDEYRQDFYIDDNPPDAVLEVAAELDKLFEFARERNVQIQRVYWIDTDTGRKRTAKPLATEKFQFKFPAVKAAEQADD